MSKFNIYKVDNKTSTTTNATPETIIASQIGEAIIGEYNPDFSYRAVEFGTSADTFEAMQNNNQAIGTLELTSKSAGEWMDTLSEIHNSVIDVFEAVIDARETFNLKLKKIFDISSGEKNFHSLGTIASNIECIPSPDALKPLHEIFRSCLQERYKFKFNK